MKIVMMTNTYKPIVGGLERSVTTFAGEYRQRGHDVLIVAPEHKGAPEKEEGVFRIPAIQNFNGTDFSVELPIHFDLLKVLDKFRPDIVHSHHPFLIGDTALRVAERYEIPLVFTHHTLYEEYAHYVPVSAELLKEFVVRLATEYANLCDHVFAPSESIADLIRRRGVETKIDVIPTGIYVDRFSLGEGWRFRDRMGIARNVPVAGIVGRLAREKNIDFLLWAMVRFLKKKQDAQFLVVGSGPLQERIRQVFEDAELSSRLHSAGSLSGQDLIDAYHALDVFAFASHSETQGLVLAEAMAAGVPVVGVDAPGVREVVEDRVNGRLIGSDDEEIFCEALEWYFTLPEEKKEEVRAMAKKTAQKYEVSRLVDKALTIYGELTQKNYGQRPLEDNPWMETLRLIKAEIKLAKGFSRATGAVLNAYDR